MEKLELQQKKIGSSGELKKYVIVSVGDYFFAIDAIITQDILKSQQIKSIPLSPEEVMGVFNLRGKIVTVIDLSYKIGLKKTPVENNHKNVVIDHNGSLYSLLVDEIIEVIDISSDDITESPYDSFAEAFENISFGVCTLKDRLIIILDICFIMANGRKK